ncbi:3-deoxy-D-manno-octulosonic acid transferase [Ochrovirga pacifica]|uniref:3-deoxy-D-manno-octulosonic acid transferase n=1 Tax=Ochrovirga pacifica TaxID=1042376 RepID=UPI00025591FF|nr:glycosyltransferase N-terminal domain-containing protein [Ochrovirga pacifica]
MQIIYTLFTHLATFLLRLVALFQPKIKLFVQGRRQSFSKIAKEIDANKSVVWIHAASLGEFEQGRPIIEALKKTHPEHQILVTFFSPSGYQVRKDYPLASCVCYLPMDTMGNAKKWVTTLKPKVAIFIKYEFWPNYLLELKEQQIPTLLISGIFRENQQFFKPYGFWMNKALKAFTHFFVQDALSKKLLTYIGFNNVTIAGDTRFDRVQKLIESNEKLDFIQAFVQDAYVLVAGSTWPEDEEQLLAYINHQAKENEKFIIAPHNIKKEDIQNLQKNCQKKVVLFSEKEGKNLSEYDVFVVDTFGILSKIYAYAHVAYVGGGYTKSGVHNTLEAATYGLPIVIGPNFKKFKEVQDLVALKGCISVTNVKDLISELNELRDNDFIRENKSTITKNYVTQNLGATSTILKEIYKLL